MLRTLSRVDRRVLAGVAVTILALHVVVVVLLLIGIAGQDALATGTIVSASVGAYLLGARHAFDADHIATIDVTTRKLADERTGAWSVGLWFALGHSSVVLMASLLVGLGVPWAREMAVDESTTGRVVFGLIAPMITFSFLVVMAVWNAGTLRQLRAGGSSAAGPRPGPLGRALAPVLQVVRRPRHMYATGLLFGLGMDTAADIALILIAGTVAVTQPLVVAVALPLAFAAGMSLFDALDGIAMRAMYAWAGDHAHRRVRYTLVVTWASFLLAVVVAGVVAVSIASTWLPAWSPVTAVASWNSPTVGAGIVVLAAAGWAAMVLLQRRRPQM